MKKGAWFEIEFIIILLCVLVLNTPFSFCGHVHALCVCVCVLFSLPVARALERGCGRGFHTERGLRRALSSRPPCCQIGQFYFKTKLVQNPSSAVD